MNIMWHNKRQHKETVHIIKEHKKIASIIIAGILMVSGIICASYLYIVQAKYVTSVKGGSIISANSFYFTSDYLNKADNSGNTSEYIMHGWDGKSKKSFGFNIRNYDNPLLYNNEDQDVKYEFNYEILNGDEANVNVDIYKMVNGEEVGELNGELEGGADSFNINEYKMSVTSKNPMTAITHDISVLIKVNTIESPYYTELSTIVTLQYSQFENFIAEQGFDNTTNNSRAYVMNYFINTANEINTSEMENTDTSIATDEIHIEWDNTKLEFDGFDNKINDLFAKKTLDEVQTEYESVSDCKNVIIIDDSTGKGHFYFDALAFSSFKISFYKRAGIDVDENIWKNEKGQYLWEAESKPVTDGGLVFAEVVK